MEEDLTDRQREVAEFLKTKSTYKDIATKLGVSRSTARDYIRQLRNRGLDILETKEDGVKVLQLAEEVAVDNEDGTQSYPVSQQFTTAERRSKAAITSEAKDKVRALIQHLRDDLNGRAPPMPDDGLSVRESREDMVVHRSDDHIGARYTDEFGDNTFDAETGIERVMTVSDRTFRLKRRQEKAGIEFDTLHLLLGGDHLHGVGIYPSQPWETELPVPEQIAVASDLYMEFIDRAVDEFETVQVVCQRGNHGELRGDGMGPDDNLDDAFFMTLDKRIRDRGYENVKFVQSQGGHFTNFPLRGSTLQDCKHRGHLRHGQNSLEHIGTSAGKKRWLQWLHQHGFDIAYRGHYHTFRIEQVSSTPVIESGAIIPPSDYEESLAEWSEPAATVHGVSDTRPMTWFYAIDFDDE